MSKRLLPILISAVLLLSTSLVAFAANSPQDVINENKIKFQQLDDKILGTNLEISNLNNQTDNLKKIIEKNNSDIAESEIQIKSAEVKKDMLNKEVISSMQLAGKRLRAMYIANNNGNYLSVLLSSKDLSDFLSKLLVIQKIASLDKKLLMDLDSKKDSLNKSIIELDIRNKQLQELRNSNAASLENLDMKKKELETLSKQFDAEKKAAASIIEENENKLVYHSISVINSQTSNINVLRSAIDTLKSLLPQLSTASVKKKAENCIKDGNKKLAILIANNSASSGSNGSVDDTYKATYSVVATAYTGYGLTAMGLKPVRDPNGISTIAVDPSFIPLGTKVFIPGYGYAICADTGGAIIGNKIDLFLNSETECFDWGRRTVTLNVIAYPGEW